MLLESVRSCRVMIPVALLLFGLILYASGGPQRPLSPDLFDAKHGVKMGVPTDGCDDGKTALTVDWSGDSLNYTCFYPTKPLIPDSSIRSNLYCDNVPKGFYPQHFCMKQTIQYNELLPTYGDHRPLWPRYGEYRFVPVQRWLHNIEHGAVIMLYDPCTLDSEVQKLKKIVQGCIKKHVITPTTFLSSKRPLALIAWGCKLEMSKVNEEEVVQFIRDKGLKGPEGDHPKDGQYDWMLMTASSDLNHVATNEMNDEKLCSNFT